MLTFGKIIKYTLVCLLGLLILAIAALLLFEQPVPDSLLRRLTKSFSNKNYLVRADSASFRFSHGLKINNLRVFDRRKTAEKPMISASCVDLALNLRRIPWSRSTMLKAVTITDLRYPRLPDGYYIPDSVEFPGQPDFKEKNEPLKLDLPRLQPFRLTLIHPEVLGVTPKKVVAHSVSVTPDGIRMDGIHLDWPDADAQLTVDGFFEFNLEKQIAEGKVHGLARQHHFRPMLVALDLPIAYPFIDGFTRVEKPVDAACAFDVNLRNNDFHIRLDLAPEGGYYNHVPLESVRGPVDIRVFVRDTFQNARIVVGPLVANLADGSRLSGQIVYENTNDVGFVDFNVRSSTSISNVLAVADAMNDGSLDGVVPATPPSATLIGRLAVDPAHAAANNLTGTLAFNRGTLFSVPVRNASTRFDLHGTDISFSDARATAEHGGNVSGEATISIPGFKQDNGSFQVKISGEKIALADLADVFKFDLGDKRGFLNGHVALSGPLSTNLTHRLGGGGQISCTDGHLAQMRLFSGFTSYLAKYVPGIGSIVNLSNASLDFAITNGMLHASNAVIAGDVLAINAVGKYDIPGDDLDFSGNITLKKNEGMLMRLATTPIRWPFAKIFGFHLKGEIDNPTWSYEQNIISLPSVLK
ncbi:MAG: hypothetical protein J6V72_15355 [Kiritimatiellae bacterium]|nr:hypothetical protein [Kiritimatiellia bacterium]